MAETIESFVIKLKTEGIQQGKQEAEQIKEKAHKEADRLLAEAKAQADKIIADANSQAEGIMSRSRTELELASRDTVLKLRESLQHTLQSVLLGPVEKGLNDEAFLKDMIKSIMDRFLSLNTLSPNTVHLYYPYGWFHIGPKRLIRSGSNTVVTHFAFYTPRVLSVST